MNCPKCPFCEDYLEIDNFYPDSEGQECHYQAGEEYFCIKCGQTLNMKMYNLYHRFLLSKQWKRIKFEVLMRDGFICQNCKDEACEVHHIHYGDILDKESCISLCSKCHSKEHNKKPRDKIGWACSINIIRMAKRYNLLNCPECDNPFSFYETNGFYVCDTCEMLGNKMVGDIKDFALLCKNRSVK